MTRTQHEPVTHPTTEPVKPSPIVSPRQVLVGGLAAASAAFVASYFGVAGTVLGTALFSVVATTANALYEHFVRRTSARLTTLAGTSRQLRGPVRRMPPPRRLPWGGIAAGATVVFVVAIAGITGFELLVGKPVSALLGRSGGHGTSIVRVVESQRHHAPRSPEPSAPQPTPSTIPSATPTGPATPTPSPSPSVTSPTGPSTPTPTASIG